MLLEREDQLRTFAELVERADRECGCTVLLAGEAGIGKTVLLQAFASQQEPSRQVFWGACEPLSTSRPLGPLQDMAVALDPALAKLLEQGAMPSSIFARVLAALQKPAPAKVLIFEDVHWADHATLDLIRYLGRRLPAVPALLILSLRSDEVDPGDALAHLAGDLPAPALERVTLPPLSANAVTTLAREAGRDGDELYRITAGNPFFVSVLLADGDDAQGALPVTIRDAVWARLARLDAQERWILDLIGVMPGSVEHGLWTTLRAEDIAAAERCVARGILVRDAAGALAFRHELTRQAVLEQMAPEEERQMHAHVLALLERRAGSASVPLARLVHHAAAAEDAGRVLSLAPRAAAEAAVLGAHRQATQQLELALRFVAQADDAVAAQLYQDWAYEAGISLRVSESVISARHQAIKIWRRLGRHDQVGHNLRWLSRLHWYRGDGKQAEEYADAAVRELEALPPGSELAMAYSMRSQIHMLRDRFELAIEWGQRALALAEQVGDIETRVHALNNVGTAQLFGEQFDPAGRAKLEQSLQLGLLHGCHEHTARAYANLAEYAFMSKDLPLAERLLGEGIAFNREHDLDVGTNYMVGWKARLRLTQGRLHEAESMVNAVVAMKMQSVVERLPAMLVLGWARARLGLPDALNVLQGALDLALPTAEPQHVVPLRLALVEAAWIKQDMAACDVQLSALEELTGASLDAWECGELAVWQQRRQVLPAARAQSRRQIPEPWAAELRGDPVAAAEAWLKLGVPCEAALALLQVRGAGAGAALARAWRVLAPLDAQALLARVRGLADELGVADALPHARRGRYSVARKHPLGLTRREQQVLALLSAGYGNQDIAQRLSRSPRTVEHHVAGIYTKLGVSSRVQLLLRLQDEPWLRPERPGRAHRTARKNR